MNWYIFIYCYLGFSGCLINQVRVTLYHSMVCVVVQYYVLGPVCFTSFLEETTTTA